MLALLAFAPAKSYALPYDTCQSAEKSAACLIAFEKLQTLTNPLTRKRYFHDGIHIDEEMQLLKFPTLFVSTPDLDQDGSPEIIVSIPETTQTVKGNFCPAAKQCPHFIIQDRSLPDQKRTINTFTAIGPIFTYSIALSTDEVVDNYRSLRAYTDGTWQKFDVYQYDRSTDQYYNMSVNP